ncbi:unnamed protein product, partial [Ectocarpus sp. 12 AP-2014]
GTRRGYQTGERDTYPCFLRLCCDASKHSSKAGNPAATHHQSLYPSKPGGQGSVRYLLSVRCGEQDS